MPDVVERPLQDTFPLSKEGKRLWTRDKAKEIRSKVERSLDQIQSGGVLVVDASGVEVFDYSFASELFGKLILRMASEFPDKYVAVSGLAAYTRENLNAALQGAGVMLLEIRNGRWDLLGKVSPSDKQTISALRKAGSPIGAPELAKALGINVTACNERLTKLAQFGLVRRQEAGTGRLQYLYSPIL